MAPPRDARAVRALLDRIAEDSHVTRRDYLRILATVSGGLFAGSVAIGLGLFPRRHDPDEELAAKFVASDIPPGESVKFGYPTDDDPALAVRLDGGQLVAYSSVCTHLACAVLWRREDGALECPCHDGVFEPATGNVVAGPPPRPLPRILLEERPDGIFAVGVEA